MTTPEAKEKLSQYLHTSAALGHASGLVYYDGDTVAPPKSAAVRANTLSELSRISYELTCAPETTDFILSSIRVFISTRNSFLERLCASRLFSIS